MTLYESIQALGTRPKATGKTSPTGDINQDNMTLNGAPLPSYLYEAAQNQLAPNVYKPPSFDYGNMQTQSGVAAAETKTTSPQAVQKNAEAKAAAEEVRRPRGRAANLLTGSQGLLSEPNISRRSLLGF